ncbi:PEP-CTERM sorting domain-containing protein [uncultured Pseudodesulfovibrio sp.]|uniref:PEP-CTERM sorting domain-containing protein n=1 Tax=uncultured Pseudodesulfovibrio sp. TaxID=2035858 RepID=UPI0029C7A5B0|nr:PEP-CTERM sorting domain-containing protein [uncultured Pseudodesulfovibrio sp.]
MKKLFMYFALALTVLAMPGISQAANIYGWTLDLSDYSGNTFSDIAELSVYGYGDIDQSYGGDGVLSSGDTFTVSSMLYNVAYTDINGVYYNNPDWGGGLELFFASDNLSGIVTNVDPVTGNFDYEYQSGDITLYFGNSNDIANATALATMSLSWGLGDSTSENNGGQALSGETDMGIQFITSVLANGLIWFDVNDYPELAALYPNLSTFLTFDLNNNLNTNIVPLTLTQDGFTARVTTGGDITLVATPEPSTFLILGFGLLGLVGFRKKFKKA